MEGRCEKRCTEQKNSCGLQKASRGSKAFTTEQMSRALLRKGGARAFIKTKSAAAWQGATRKMPYAESVNSKKLTASRSARSALASERRRCGVAFCEKGEAVKRVSDFSRNKKSEW